MVPKSLLVHLVCGAGTGSPVMKALVDEGYRVTAGVLNLLDTDQETARVLSIPTANEAPFSPKLMKPIKQIWCWSKKLVFWL